eukprot:498548-Pyramimonas_sp.AAC.1
MASTPDAIFPTSRLPPVAVISLKGAASPRAPASCSRGSPGETYYCFTCYINVQAGDRQTSVGLSVQTGA